MNAMIITQFNDCDVFEGREMNPPECCFNLCPSATVLRGLDIVKMMP